MTRFDSAFNLGIIAAKYGHQPNNNPFDEDPHKSWWLEGFEVAYSDKYKSNITNEYLKDKVISPEEATHEERCFRKDD